MNSGLLLLIVHDSLKTQQLSALTWFQEHCVCLKTHISDSVRFRGTRRFTFITNTLKISKYLLLLLLLKSHLCIYGDVEKPPGWSRPPVQGTEGPLFVRMLVSGKNIHRRTHSEA